MEERRARESRSGEGVAWVGYILHVGWSLGVTKCILEVYPKITPQDQLFCT